MNVARSLPQRATAGESDGTRFVVEVARDFEAIGAAAWNGLWQRAEIPSVFARHEWAEAWWKACADGREPRLYGAYTEGRLVGILPTLRSARRRREAAVLIGDEHADYAAILTEAGRPGVFAALVQAACEELPARSRLMLRDVRSDSSYADELAAWAREPGARWQRVETMRCPRTSLAPDRLQALVNKDSLRRHTRQLGKLGKLRVSHFIDAPDILVRLEPFFRQHVERWAVTDSPSLFLKQRNRALYRELATRFSGTGLLVFTEIAVDGVPAAFHFGFISEGDFIWYKPTFDPAFARASPGEVLLRELFLWAAARGLSGFDFTRGGEAFKNRFSDGERSAHTYVYHANRLDALASQTWRSCRHVLRSTLPTSLVTALRRWERRRGA
jgi:CelD/BcsL family acetyltransferase involved in cellulose biosynthesis